MGPRPRRSHAIWIAVASIVLALIVYFLFFTATPDDATRTGVGSSPSAVGQEPVAPPPAN
jgi:hypothetical protein